MLFNDSLNMILEDEEKHLSQTQVLEIDRMLNSNRSNSSKCKEQLNHSTQNTLTSSPSLNSITLTKLSTNVNTEQIYWSELCIERGIDLAAKDINCTSDPYVKVLYGTEEKYTTNIISKNLNPIWNEKFTFFIHDLYIPLYFNLYDYDHIGRDESMGRAKIDLWKLPFDKLYTPTLELQDEQRNDGKHGTIKINMTITPSTIEFRDEVKTREDFKKCYSRIL